MLPAGCGGGSPDRKANDAYASRVCTALGSWLTEVRSVDAVPAPGDVTKASITARLNGFEKATEKFVSELEALPPPDTAEGRAAQKELDEQLIPGARGEIASARTVASTMAANGSMLQVAAALAALPDPRALEATAQSTLTAVQSAKGSLASSFTSERACRQVG